MADFCRGCCITHLGVTNTNDFAGLCKPDEASHVLCEGCGEMIWVDHTGQRIEMIHGNPVKVIPNNISRHDILMYYGDGLNLKSKLELVWLRLRRIVHV